MKLMLISPPKMKMEMIIILNITTAAIRFSRWRFIITYLWVVKLKRDLEKFIKITIEFEKHE